jgi:hypothetical protein
MNQFYIKIFLLQFCSVFGKELLHKEGTYSYSNSNDLQRNSIFEKIVNSSGEKKAEEKLGLRERPIVKQISPFCTTAVQRLKFGPPNIP